MSKNWYPVINYENCIECGACIEHCCKEVYDTDKAPVPHVINPDGCVEGCKGCGPLCPAEAITYFGDDGKTEGCCCEGSSCCGDSGCC